MSFAPVRMGSFFFVFLFFSVFSGFRRLVTSGFCTLLFYFGLRWLWRIVFREQRTFDGLPVGQAPRRVFVSRWHLIGNTANFHTKVFSESLAGLPFFTKSGDFLHEVFRALFVVNTFGEIVGSLFLCSDL